MTRILPLLLIIVSSINAIAQENLLMLQKRNRHKNAYYKIGDEISFRARGMKGKVTSVILNLRDTTIVFDGFRLPVSRITSLYIDEKTKWWLRFKVAQLGLIGGGGYLLLDLINTGEFNQNTLIVGGSIMAVGGLAQILIGNRIKIKGRTRLRIVNLKVR